MTETDVARHLVEQALDLCQLGERAPGAGPWPAETWLDWAQRAEAWLRAQPAPSTTVPNVLEHARCSIQRSHETHFWFQSDNKRRQCPGRTRTKESQRCGKQKAHEPHDWLYGFGPDDDPYQVIARCDGA
jgi:hypothetical protein